MPVISQLMQGWPAGRPGTASVSELRVLVPRLGPPPFSPGRSVLLVLLGAAGAPQPGAL